MAKLFLLSIIIGMITLAVRAARTADARAGLRKALIQVAVLNAAYLFGLMFLYGRSGAIHAAYMAGIVLLFRFI